MAKKVVAGLGTTLAAVLLSFAAYDFTQFSPHRDRIAAIVTSADESDRNPPAQVISLIQASLNGRTSLFATRLIMAELGTTPPHHMGIRGALWTSLVALHYSERDRITIILSKAYTGDGRTGVSATSRALFKKELSQLSLDEAATIIALTKHPAALKDPEQLSKMKGKLLAKISKT